MPSPETFNSRIEARLSEFEATGRRKKLPQYSFRHLSSNDYLGLSRHPGVIEAIIKTTAEEGSGATGSRLLSGNHPLNGSLEEAIADFKGGPSALVFTTGYQANISMILALSSIYPFIYSDSHIHASLIDGIRLSGSQCQIFPHNDTEELRGMLEKKPLGDPFVIITESLFSMDGDRSPIAALLNLCDEFDGILFIDDAHGTGTLGQEGRGGLEHASLAFNPQRIVLTGTFSKALGGLGGYSVCHPLIRELTISAGRSFIYTTALPPGILAGNLAALAILDEDCDLVSDLRSRVRKVREAMGLPFSSSPIIPIKGPVEKLQSLSTSLREKGLLGPVIHPPSVPEGMECIRISVTNHWDDSIIEQLAESVKNAGVLP
jgi:8-amino-7-oxononanoate synthase